MEYIEGVITQEDHEEIARILEGVKKALEQVALTQQIGCSSQIMIIPGEPAQDPLALGHQDMKICFNLNSHPAYKKKKKEVLDVIARI